jgi:hypothetical protein
MTTKPIPAALAPLSDLATHGEPIVAFDCAALLGPASPFPIPGLHHTHLSELTAQFLADHAPKLIILPLFAAQYDAMTAIEMLETLGYSSQIAVLAPKLPKPKLVEAELRGLGPGARLTLITP